MIEISTAQDLYNIRNDLTADYVQTRDIDLSAYGSNFNQGKGWTPIGDSEHPFTGSFDGGNFKIKNLYSNFYDSFASNYYAGLFCFSNGATFQNINIQDAYVAGNNTGILLCGTATDTDFTNCHVWNGYIGGKGDSGLVQDLIGGNITLCSSVIKARVWVCGCSGIFATATGTTISKCWTQVDIAFASYDPAYIWQSDTFCGFGQLAIACTISDCYTMGSIYGHLWVSGFIQTIDFSLDYEELYGVKTNITNCYCAVELKSNDDIVPISRRTGNPEFGAFIHENCYDSAIITSCYYDNDVSLTNQTDGGIGKTTVQMQDKDTFEDWDFVDTWKMTGGVGYPILQDNEQTIFISKNDIDIVMDKSVTIKAKAFKAGMKDSAITTKQYAYTNPS